MTGVRSWHSAWLLLVRLYAGVFWLVHGIPKFTLSERFMPPGGFMPQVVQHAASTSTGAYHGFLTGIVIPNIYVFAELDRLGEVLVGLSLLFGLLTPLGGIAGCFLAFNYMAALGEFNTPMTMAGSLEGGAFVLSFLSIPLGGIMGVDRILFGRPKRSRTVHAEFVDEPPLGARTSP